MKKIVFLLMLVYSYQAFSQSDIYLTIGPNYYFNYSNAGQLVNNVSGSLPVNSIFTVGASIGAIYKREIQEDYFLIADVGINRHSFNNGYVHFTDLNGYTINTVHIKTIEWFAGASIMAGYQFYNNTFISCGIGTQMLLDSRSKTDAVSNIPGRLDVKDKDANKYYKLLMPTVPVELYVTPGKFLIGIRYEHGLTNRLKKDSEFIEKFGLLTLKLGIKITNSKE